MDAVGKLLGKEKKEMKRWDVKDLDEGGEERVFRRRVYDKISEINRQLRYYTEYAAKLEKRIKELEKKV